MELEELFKDRSREAISALVYNMGRMTETAIVTDFNNAIKQRQDLEAKIMSFRIKLDSRSPLHDLLLQEFDNHFNIISERRGG